MAFLVGGLLDIRNGG